MNCSNYFQYGDVIKTYRPQGYCHYGIYESDYKVYEYSPENGETEISSKANIHITSIWKFANKCKVGRLVFPDRYSKGEEIQSVAHINVWNKVSENEDYSSDYSEKIYDNPLEFFLSLFEETTDFKLIPNYRVYSPKETIQRAKSRLSEQEYSLINNNCECYALFCKLGLNISTQVIQLPETFKLFINNTCKFVVQSLTQRNTYI